MSVIAMTGISELSRFADGDRLTVGIDDEHGGPQAAHAPNAAHRSVQLLDLLGELASFLREPLEPPARVGPRAPRGAECVA